MKHSFIHVADVHLDRPLDNLRRRGGDLSAKLHESSRQSFARTIDLAISRSVDAFLIAGDLFDGPVRDASAGLWVSSQFKKLLRQNIPVFLIRGNHDAANASAHSIQWPEGVTEFATAHPETHLVESANFAIHGQSFGSRTETNDLASKYPSPVSGCFNIGLLHTSLSGSAQHDTYAPTSIGTLENAGYDYWGLGHVHIRSESSLSSKCFIGYSGNTQGCHIRESGAKGCNLVTVQDNKLTNVEFVATDRFRWHEIDLDISQVGELHELEDILHAEGSQLAAIADGRPMGVRVNLVGDSTLHSELTRPSVRDNLMRLVMEQLEQQGDFWLEALKVRSSPANTRKLENIELPVQYLTRVTESARIQPELRSHLREELEELLKKVRHELGQNSMGSDIESEECFDRYLRDAENQLIAGLLGEAS
ncbi:MAG: exonuclease SbcCD subunit D [Aureliella sp.]